MALNNSPGQDFDERTSERKAIRVDYVEGPILRGRLYYWLNDRFMRRYFTEEQWQAELQWREKERAKRRSPDESDLDSS